MAQRDARSGAARQRSFRLPVDLLDDLESRAKEVADSANGLASRLLREGLRTDRHPLIGFREGPHGQRRPALVGTRLFIWQIVNPCATAPTPTRTPPSTSGSPWST